MSVRGNDREAPPAGPVLPLLLPPDASPEDMKAFTSAAAWLADGLALWSCREAPTPSGPVPGPLPAAAPRPRFHQCQP
jgi:hypothetical protein